MYGPLWNTIDLQLSLINDVLRPLMNTSADLNIGNPEDYVDDFDRIREEILYNINATIAGTSDFNLTTEITRYFIEGLILLYYNASFEAVGSQVSGITPTQRNCLINEVYRHFYPVMEQAKIAALGRRLQQIAVAYEVARKVSVFTV